jgi:hypothetical protein
MKRQNKKERFFFAMSYSWRLTQILYASRQEKRKRWAVLAPHSAALGCSQSGGFYHSYST